MTKIYTREQMQGAVEKIDVVAAMEEAFQAYSNGQMVVSPPGEMAFKNPVGSLKLTYGYLKSDPYYLVKTDASFPGNEKKKLPISSGMATLNNRETGEVMAVFLDGGYLTAVRTAAAGAVAAKYLGPKQVKRIGIFGTGVQARMQLETLRRVTDCREVMVFGRTAESRQAFIDAMTPLGFHIEGTEYESDVAESCNLIVTATPSQMPLLTADQIRPGTHITAVGATTPQKIELAPLILKNADIVVVDSLEESKKRGEAFHAVQTGLLKQSALLELGKVIANPAKGRKTEEEVTVVDLAGLPAQDMQIAKVLHAALSA